MSHWGRRPSRTFPVQQQPPWNSFLPRRVETPHRCPDRGESYISIATPTTWRAILFVSSRQTGKKTLRRAMDNRRFTRVCLGARTIEHNRKKRRETTCCGSIESNFWFIHRTGTENPFIFDSFFFICCWGSAILSINIEST